MKNKCGIILILIFLVMFFVSCSKKEQRCGVYSFSGENDYFTVNEGVVVISFDEKIFDGGNLKLKNKNFSNIKSYKTSYYVNNKDNPVLVNSVVDESGGSIKIASDLGKISGELDHKSKNSLFDWISDLSNKLYFEIEIENLSGEKHVYQIPMKIDKVTKN